jgi:hypothetical protein
MNNFNLIKFLAEGKLHEEAASTEEAMDKPSTKMKMSELKKKIRQEILAELTLSEDSEVDVNISDPDPEYDPLAEAAKDKDGKVPSKDANTDIDIEDEVDIDVEEKPKAGGDGDFLDQLEDLKDEADAIGDNKLERQVDNTITYFTRQHIAKDTNESLELEEADKDYYDAAERDDAAHIAALEKDMKDDKRSSMNESLEILKMKKLAGLLTEGEYAKALLRENQVNNKYVVKDEKLSDEDYGFYYIDQQKAFDYLKQFNNSEVSAKQFIKDDEGWGEFEQYINNIEQMSDKELEDAMRQEMSYYFFSKPDEI